MWAITYLGSLGLEGFAERLGNGILQTGFIKTELYDTPFRQGIAIIAAMKSNKLLKTNNIRSRYD